MNSNLVLAPQTTSAYATKLALPSQAQAARFSSAVEAETFARQVASDAPLFRGAQVASDGVGEEFCAQILVSRELFYWKPPVVIPGTILVDENKQAVGLSFCAYTEECDSGHELHWIENLHGSTVHSALIPR